MLYEQIKQKSSAIDSFRNELDEMRSEYDFYDLGMHLENLNMKLAESRSSYTTEKGKLEVYQASLPEKDSLIITTKARIEGSLSNIEALETEIERFDTIKKRYDELTFKLRADLEQLNKLNAQYENTANAFEPFINSIRLERLASDYTHEQMILNELRQKYEDAIQNYENPIPSIYVINRAEPSYEKASPSLFKNGLIIILSTMVLVVGLLALLEKFKSIKKALNEPAG
jgi:chromosome segregation ATPase